MKNSSDCVTTAERRSRPAAKPRATLDLPTTKWFDGRGISLPTLERLPVGSDTAVYFPDAGTKHRAAIFHYSKGWKARSIEGKHHVSGGGFEREFWNLQAVLEGPLTDVYIVEGEPDAVALVEAGIPANQVLAAQGAKDKPTEGDPNEQAGYAYVKTAFDAGLSKAKRIVWCGDNDPAGLLLRDDMVKLIGAARFWFIRWPDGVKDANQMLLSDGAEALREFIEHDPVPWPIDGIYLMRDLPEPPPMVTWEPGFPEWETKVRLAPRTMSVVTGHPGHGKTAVMAQIWFNVVRKYQVPMAILTFETRAKPHFRRQLRTLYAGKRETEMNDAERAKADKWIDEFYLWIVHPTGRPTLNWYLDTVESAVVRYGCRIAQLDPWNRMEQQREKGESEPDYIARCLMSVHDFAQLMNCHMQILAHPAKMEGQRRGQPPQLEDIAGAKHWDNMPDQGFCVHRPDILGEERTKAEVYHRKARFDELGIPHKFVIRYDVKKGAFKSEDYKV